MTHNHVTTCLNLFVNFSVFTENAAVRHEAFKSVSRLLNDRVSDYYNGLLTYPHVVTACSDSDR